jgi:flagellar M-ring protein FliF
VQKNITQTISRLGQELLSIWKQLGLNQRISIIFAGAAVIIGLGSLAYFSGRPSFALLYGGLDDTESGKVIAALTESKTPYQIGRGGSSILVPADKVAQVRMQLATKGIPRGEGVGFEIFDKPNFGISDFVQRQNYVRALQGELSRTISQLEGVEAARVLVVIPENRLLTDNTRKPTASVFLRVKGRQQLPNSSIDAIRFLVANAVEGLSANNVVVADNLGKALSANREDNSATGQSSSQLEARRELEKYLATKAEGMLERVLGPGQAVVRVAAEINWETVSKTEEKFDPETVQRSSMIDDETLDTTTGENTAPPVGTATNSSTETNKVSGLTNSSKTKKKRTTTQFEISRITSTIAQGVGGIKRLSAAVFVASRYEGTGADRKLVERKPEDLQKLRRIVQSALGILENGTPQNDQITLEEMPFNEEAVVEMSKQLEKDTRMQFYWDVGRNVVYALLGLGFLLAFLKLVNRPAEGDLLASTQQQTSIPINIPAQDASASETAPTLASLNTRRRDAGPGVVTVEMLNQLIRENPEGVTQAVRSWLTRGSNANN